MKRHFERPTTLNPATFIVTKTEYTCSEEDEKSLAPAHGWIEDEKNPWKPSKDIDPTHIDQALLWRNLNRGRSIHITGIPGAGKSTLTHSFIEHLSEQDKAEKVAIGGTTASAALLIQGETVHRLLGLGLAEESPEILWNTVYKFRNAHKRKTFTFLTQTKLLIIDEISMMQPEFFDKLDYLFRKAQIPYQPFGGIQLFVVGDFTQLEPVNKNGQNNGNGFTNPNQKTTNYVFQTKTWKAIPWARVVLDRSFRQDEADPLAQTLTHIRVGHVTEDDLALLNSRVLPRPEKGQEGIEPVCLFAHNARADAYNQNRLTQMTNQGAKLHKFAATFKIQAKKKKIDPKEWQEAETILSNPKTILSRFPMRDIEICEGAQVMNRHNRYADVGVVNGSTGIVESIDDNTVRVRFVMPDQTMAPRAMPIPRASFTSSVGKTVEIVMVQFPLTLSWACTIHKAQGQTLPLVHVDVNGIFCAGQALVALSRVRKIEHMTLSTPLLRRHLIVDEQAVQFETNWKPKEEDQDEKEHDQGDPNAKFAKVA